jgi:hypothetical protein
MLFVIIDRAPNGSTHQLRRDNSPAVGCQPLDDTYQLHNTAAFIFANESAVCCMGSLDRVRRDLYAELTE